jgi:hypothetical protein
VTTCANCNGCNTNSACCPYCNCIDANTATSAAELASAPAYVTLAPSKAVLPPIWPPIAWILGLAALAWVLSRKKG